MSRPRTESASYVAARVTQRSVLYVLLAIAGFLFLLPLFWLFVSSFKTNSEIYQWPLAWWPAEFRFDNFVRAWESAPFGRFLVNSTIVTVVGTIGKVLLALTTAYAFVFLRFPFKNVLFVILLSALMIPGNVTLILNYLTVSNLGWINTYLGLIVPGMGSVFGMFLLRQHFMSIPAELLEAAEMDGAGHWRRLFGIVAPISRPVIVTVAIIAVIDEWNSFIWPLIVTNTESMRTLPIGLFALKAEDTNVGDWGVLLAGTVAIILPMLIIFFLAQRFIVGGLTQGAVKG